jgi:hypothetical protein
MAVDKLEIEHHLTAKGWIAGNSWWFGRLQGGEEAVPENRVLTVIERTYQASAYSPESVTFPRNVPCARC